MKYLFAILAGLLNTVQSGANATLEGELKAGPTVPALVVYAGGILGILVASPFLGWSMGDVSRNAAEVPWWAWLGGLMASVYVVATLTIAADMGAATFTAVTVTASVVASLVMDHFGLVGFDVREISWGRVAGGLMMVGGVALVART